MKLNLKANKKRTELKTWKEKWENIYINLGYIKAKTEFNKNLELLSNEYHDLLTANDKIHEIALKSASRKESEYEYLCKIQRDKNEELEKSLNNIRVSESEIAQYARDLEAMLHSEKVQKYHTINHHKNESQILLRNSEKEAARIL